MPMLLGAEHALSGSTPLSSCRLVSSDSPVPSSLSVCGVLPVPQKQVSHPWTESTSSACSPALLQNRPEWEGVQMIYYYQMDSPWCSGGPPPRTRFALPITRERRPSRPEIGEKEQDYLLKELYRLKSNAFIEIPKSFRIPTKHSPPFPLCPVRSTVSQKKE